MARAAPACRLDPPALSAPGSEEAPCASSGKNGTAFLFRFVLFFCFFLGGVGVGGGMVVETWLCLFSGEPRKWRFSIWVPFHTDRVPSKNGQTRICPLA